MRDNDDDNGTAPFSGFGSGSKGRGSSRSYESSYNTAASDYNSSEGVDSEKTRVMGMEVSKGAATGYHFIINQFLPYISDRVDEGAAKHAKTIAQDWFHITDHAKAAEIGAKAGKYLGWATILAEPAANLGGTFYSATSSLNELRQAVAPVLKAQGVRAAQAQVEAVFSNADNEVVATARTKIFSVMKQRVVDAGVRTIGILPAIAIRANKQKAKAAEYEEMVEQEALAKATPEERAKMIAKKYDGKLKVEAELLKQKQETVKATTEQAMRELEEFKRSQPGKDAVARWERELNEEVASLNAPGSTHRSEYTKYNFLKQDTTTKKWSISSSSPEYKRIKEQKLKEEFCVSGKMPLDESWLPKNRLHRRDKIKTRLDMVEETHERMVKAIEEETAKKSGEHKHGESGFEKSFDVVQQGFLALGSVASDIMGNILGLEGLKQYTKPIALDYILHLKREVTKAQKDGQSLPDRISGIAMGKDRDGEKGYVQFVNEVFQQNQRDHRRGVVNERFMTHFVEADWNDKRIMEIPRDKLSVYEDAVVQIAHDIKTGALDPLALIVLAGDKRQKIVRDSGNSFGPKGLNGDDKVVKAAITKEIDALCVGLHSSRKLTQEEVSEAKSDLPFSEEQAREYFGPGGLPREQKAFLFAVVESMLPDKGELCKLTGLDEKECTNLRKEGQARLSKNLDAAVKVLADKFEHSPEALKVLKATADEQHEIEDLAAAADKKGVDVSGATENAKQLKTASAMVANAMVKVQGYWQDLVGKSKEVETKAEARQQEAEDGEEKEHRHARRHSHGDDEEFGEEKRKHRRDPIKDVLAKGRARGDDEEFTTQLGDDSLEDDRDLGKWTRARSKHKHGREKPDHNFSIAT